MNADEFTHMIRHAAIRGGDVTPFRYGHIASYDPTQHRVRCIIPSMTDQDGNPLLSPWMPMGTLSAGAGYGMQVIYQGGASIANPTAGEQVMIAIFDRQRGVAAVPCMFYHAARPPPATNLPGVADGYTTGADPCVVGDVVISAPPKTDGGVNTFIRIRTSGAIEIWCGTQLTAHVIGSVRFETPAVEVTGNLTVGTGASGTFRTADGRVVTVQDGIITNIY